MCRLASPTIALLVLTAWPHALHPQHRDLDPGTLIDRVLAAYGGRERLDAVQSYEMRGTLLAHTRNATATVLRVFERPNRLRIELGYPDSRELRLLDGTEGWRSGRNGTPVPAHGPLRGAMVLQAARAEIPWLLDRLRDRATFVARPGHADSALIGIQFEVGDGLMLQVYVDPGSYRVLRTQSVLHTPGLRTVFATDYADFRRVGGVLFAFHEENFASGTHTGSTDVEEVTVNPAVTPGTFRPVP